MRIYPLFVDPALEEAQTKNGKTHSAFFGGIEIHREMDGGKNPHAKTERKKGNF